MPSSISDENLPQTTEDVSRAALSDYRMAQFVPETIHGTQSEPSLSRVKQNKCSTFLWAICVFFKSKKIMIFYFYQNMAVWAIVLNFRLFCFSATIEFFQV